MTAKLKEIRLGDRTVAEASGPQLVVIGEGPQQQLKLGWILSVWLEHEKLIGMPPIIAGLPVSEIYPADALVDMITAKLLDQARTVRAQAENPQPPDAAAMMAALQAQQGNGQASS